jgi:hypothetical protein
MIFTYIYYIYKTLYFIQNTVENIPAQKTLYGFKIDEIGFLPGLGILVYVVHFACMNMNRREGV